MRFSLKWSFAATAYVALAAAAFAKPTEVLTIVLWAVSALAGCCMLLTALLAKGRPRVIAVGYALLATIFIAFLFAFPIYSPWCEYFLGEVDGDRMSLAFERYQCFVAVGAMAAGLIGALLGALAFRRAANCGRGGPGN